jgi:hypothetical protein
MPAEPKIMQTVVHVVREGSFAHCYLQCGHMLTMYEEDFKESDSLIECWACEEEKKTCDHNKERRASCKSGSTPSLATNEADGRGDRIPKRPEASAEITSRIHVTSREIRRAR